MTLLDTNVVIYSSDSDSPFFNWAHDLIVDAAMGDGVAVNAVSVAELCVGDPNPATVVDRLHRLGVQVLDVPAAAAGVCADAYHQFRERRTAESGKLSPTMPLPDFFIGAHAMIMGWELATADRSRFKTYFPALTLRTPQ